MVRITMKTAPTNTVEELYPSFLSAAAARGVRDKTLNTYKQHFRAISKRLSATTPIDQLPSNNLNLMILQMREGFDRSIPRFTVFMVSARGMNFKKRA